jgi:uncharacterized protein YjbJ (UPF0337 family)
LVFRTSVIALSRKTPRNTTRPREEPLEPASVPAAALISSNADAIHRGRHARDPRVEPLFVSDGDEGLRLRVERAASRNKLRVFGLSPAINQEATMDWNRVEGNWKQVKGSIKEQWGKLTDDDLTKINGRRDQLEGSIQERYGIARDQARSDVDAWFQKQSWQ